jgi:hypothetical protein
MPLSLLSTKMPLVAMPLVAMILAVSVSVRILIECMRSTCAEEITPLSYVRVASRPPVKIS